MGIMHEMTRMVAASQQQAAEDRRLLMQMLGGVREAGTARGGDARVGDAADAAELHGLARGDRAAVAAVLARHVFARIEDGPEIHCVYVPSGGDVPDREANDKFAHKLDFVKRLGPFVLRAGLS